MNSTKLLRIVVASVSLIILGGAKGKPCTVTTSEPTSSPEPDPQAPPSDGEEPEAAPE